MSHAMLKFTDSTTDLTAAIGGTFDPFLVALSLMIACVAGYTALLIADRISVSEASGARHVWLAAGAFAMGSGVWAMHFVGMLAYTLPIPVNYDPSLTGLSVVPAMLASAAALHFMKVPKLGFWRLNLAGLLMASGIGAMHFTGMAAMVVDAEMRYDFPLFLASIVVAHVLATLALYGKLVLGKRTLGRGTQFASAVLMGCAVCGMHYTAMASAFYFPGTGTVLPASAISPAVLALATTLLTGVILGTAIIASVVDVRLQDAHGQVRRILDSAGEGIYGLNLEGCTTFVNPATAEMIGWTSAEIIGKSQHELLHHSHADGTPYPPEECPIYRVLRDGAASKVEDEVFWRRDGTSFPVEYVSTPMRAPNGDLTGAVVTFRDVTERKTLEAQLVQAQKLESIGQLAAGIAHEINTPTQYVGDNLRFLEDAFGDLHQVLAACSTLVTAAEAGPAPEEYVTAVVAATGASDLAYLQEEIPRAIGQSLEGTARVATIVQAMKEFSHPGGAEKQLIDLNQAITSTVTVARNEWKYVAALELELAPDLPPTPCLPGELNQVVLNLIVNAAHAIKEVASDGEQGTITIGTRLADAGVELWIRDTGAGIPAAIRHKIFDPFFTTKDVGKGTGQGLAIARSVVVDKHGGTLTCESEVGRGTTFVIALPLEAEPAAVMAAEEHV